MTDEISTWPSIIDALGGTGAVADALGERTSTVSGWRKRGIPGPHWAGVARLAGELDKSEISLELLADLAAREVIQEAESRV